MDTLTRLTTLKVNKWEVNRMSVSERAARWEWNGGWTPLSRTTTIVRNLWRTSLMVIESTSWNASIFQKQLFFSVLSSFPPKISNFSEELKKGKPLIPKQLNINNFQCLWWKNPEELIQVRRNSWKFYQKSTILCSSQLKFSKPRQNISMMHKSKRKGAEGRGIGGRKIYIHNKFPWVLCSTWWLVSEERKRRNVMAQYKWQYMRKVPKKVCSHEHESWNMKQKITESTPWHLSPCLTSPKSSSPQKSQNVGDL